MRSLKFRETMRFVSFSLAIIQAFAAPVNCIAATPDKVPSGKQQSGHSSTAPPASASSSPELHFSQKPQATEFLFARVLPVALVPIDKTTAEENKALAKSLVAYSRRTNAEDYSSLVQFLEDFPSSAWKPAMLVGLGIIWRQAGYFSRAMTAWEQAWKLSKSTDDSRGRALADRAIGEFVQMNAWVGRYEVLEPLLAELGDRPVTGGASEMIAGAREGLWMMQNRPEKGFMCGPCALDEILFKGRPNAHEATLIAAKATKQGFSLAHLRSLAQECGAGYLMARREGNVTVPENSVVHWKLDHYGAVLRHEKGRYLIQDSTFSRLYGEQLWMSEAALLEESDGYFLIPGTDLPGGWQPVSETQGSKIWGRGPTTGKNSNAFTRKDHKSCEEGPGPDGMARSSAHMMLVSLSIADIPLGYRPPVGPPVEFGVTYNQRDSTSVNASFPNLGDKWNFDWASYISDNGKSAPRLSVTRYVIGGGILSHSGYNTTTLTYASDVDGGVLQYFSGTPDRYELMFRDGSKQIFSQPSTIVDNTPRQMFLTAIQDSSGNSLQIHYNANGLIDTVTDAINQTTHIYYDLANDPAKITRVQDPFSRTATFEYDANGRLHKITDAMGMSTILSYSPGSFINQMTTPYGPTTFAFSEAGLDRSLLVTDPNGDREYVIYKDDVGSAIPSTDDAPSEPRITDQNMQFRNTFYFGKKAMAQLGPGNLPGNYDNAIIYHWMHDAQVPAPVATGLLESLKAPLESRIWFTYPGQTTASYAAGTTNRNPEVVTRFVDDASSQGGKTKQTYRLTYNSVGNPTSFMDPRGRLTTNDYYSNGIDLYKIRQVTPGPPAINETLVEFGTYNAQHRPSSYIDASRRTYTLSWNAAGQLTGLLAPAINGGSTYPALKLVYSPSTGGYLMNTTEGDYYCQNCGPTWTMTYDSFGRLRTLTGPQTYTADNYSVTYDYDVLDRVTKITYPNQTFEKFEYFRLDLVRAWDRAGHRTQFSFDDSGRPVSIKDRLGRTTSFGWCGCGSIASMTNALNQVTTWIYDIEGRIIEKHYDDFATTGKKLIYTYEPRSSRLASVTDAKAQIQTFTYFSDDAPKSVAWVNSTYPAPSLTFVYKLDYARLESVTVTGNTTEQTTYTYNPITGSQTLGAGQLATIDGPLANDTIAYGYDELGRTLSRSINGVGESVQYDVYGRIASHTTPLSANPVTISYLGDTRRQLSMTYPNSRTTAFDYFDKLGDNRLKEIWNKTSGGVNISKFDYQYDLLGRITNWTQQTDANAALSFGFEYDLEGQLVNWEYPGAGSTHRSFTYGYDAMGNNTTRQAEFGPTVNLVLGKQVHNNLNQLTSRTGTGSLPARYRGTVNEPANVTVQGQQATIVPDPSSGNGKIFTGWANLSVGDPHNSVEIDATDFGAGSGNTTVNRFEVGVTSFGEKTYTYDDNGNCTSAILNGNEIDYTWDSEDRLLKITQKVNGVVQQTTEFSYDACGRRVQIVEKNASGTITSNKRHVWCGSYICEERDALNNYSVTKRFYAEGQVNYQPSTVSLFYTRDHLSSIREMIDSSGAIRARYDYGFYGNRGPNQITSNPIESDFGFTGHYFHSPSTLSLTWFRAYDVDAQRWLSRDPMGEAGGINLYGYVGNSPLNAKDSLGLADDVRTLDGGDMYMAPLPMPSKETTAGSLVDWNPEFTGGKRMGDFFRDDIAVPAMKKSVELGADAASMMSGPGDAKMIAAAGLKLLKKVKDARKAAECLKVSVTAAEKLALKKLKTPRDLVLGTIDKNGVIKLYKNRENGIIWHGHLLERGLAIKNETLGFSVGRNAEGELKAFNMSELNEHLEMNIAMPKVLFDAVKQAIGVK